MTLSHPKDAGKFTIRFFDKNLSHVILTVKKDSEKSVLFCRWGPCAARKWPPRVRKEEGPRFRGDDYESPTAYFLSIKKVGKER